MVSKETLQLFLNILKNVSVCPVANNADQDYEQLKKARNDIIEALKQGENDASGGSNSMLSQKRGSSVWSR